MTGISEPLQNLLSLASFYALLMAATVAAYWGGVLILRAAGRAVNFSLVPLGFRRPGSGAFVGAAVGFSVGFAAIFVGAVVNLISVVVFRSLGYPVESGVQQQLIPRLAGWISDAPGVAIPATIFVVVIIGPFVEELVFRGAIFNGLYRLGRALSLSTGGAKEPGRTGEVISFVVAAILSSAFFALLHLEPVLLPALLLLAVALCALYRWSGSLLPPFIAHATFNSFTTILVILSGLGVFELPA